MLMPGRSYTNGSSYRYGFNGQEIEKDVNENITTALFWEYDSRIGRRWNIDPKPNVSISPYNCFSGNPIFNMDPLGDSIPKIKFEFGKYNYQEDGTVKGAIKDFIKIFPNIAANFGNGVIGTVNTVTYNINEYDKRGLGGYLDGVYRQYSGDVSRDLNTANNYWTSTSASQKLNDFTSFIGQPSTVEAAGTFFVATKFDKFDLRLSKPLPKRSLIYPDITQPGVINTMGKRFAGLRDRKTQFDLRIFGSAVRGAPNPNDLDILIITNDVSAIANNERIMSIIHTIKEDFLIKSGKPLDVNIMTQDMYRKAKGGAFKSDVDKVGIKF